MGLEDGNILWMGLSVKLLQISEQMFLQMFPKICLQDQVLTWKDAGVPDLCQEF